MKRVLIVLLIITPFVFGGIWFYNKHFTKPLSVWQFLPPAPLIAISIENYKDEDLEETFDSFIIQQEDKKNKPSSLQLLNLLHDNEKSSALLNGNDIVLAFYNSDSLEMDLLMSMTLKQDIKELQSLFAKTLDNKIRTDIHTINGKKLFELTDNDGNNLLFYQEENIALISNNRTLMIEAITSKKELDKNTLIEQKKLRENEIHLENTSIYFNYKELSIALNDVFEGRIQQPLLGHFADFSFMEIDSQKDEVFFHGFSYTADSTISFSQNFNGQKDHSFKDLDIIPNSTAVLHYYAFENIHELSRNLDAFSRFHEMETTRKRNNDIIQSLKNHINGDIYFSWSANDIGNLDKHIILNVKSGNLQQRIVEIAQPIYTETDTSIAVVSEGISIFKADLTNLPSELMSPVYPDFNETYFCFYKNYLVCSESLPGARLFINSLKANLTWDQQANPDFKPEELFLSGNIGWFINIPEALKAVELDKTDNYFFNFLSKFRYANFEYLVESENKVYSSAKLIKNTDLITYKKTVKPSEEEIIEPESSIKTTGFTTQIELNLGKRIITKPFLVKDYRSGRRNIMLQDSTNLVYYIDGSGKILWTKQVDGPITSDVQHVDFYKNRKLQYIFSTKKAVYCVDRLGNVLEGFPFLFEEEIIGFNVIDYDHSKNYRFCVSTKASKIYVLDKTGADLKGWDPKQVEGDLAFPCNHFRIKNSDFYVAVQKDGKVWLWNRRGETEKGFPVDLGTAIKSDYYIQKSDLKSTKIVLSSSNSESIKVDLKGDYEKSLAPAEAIAGMKIINDPADSKHYFVSGNKLFNSDLDLLWEYTNYPEGNITQVYNLNEFNLIVLDDSGHQIHFYKKEGDEIILDPLKASEEIALLYSTSRKEFEVYIVYKDQLKKIKFHE